MTRGWCALLLTPAVAFADPATSLFLGGSMDAACGRGAPRVRALSRREVRTFRERRITPRLEGYTWREAVGGWQGVEERSYELLVYGGDPQEVDRVGHEWQACFCQESVLVVASDVTLGAGAAPAVWQPGPAPALSCPSGIVLPEIRE